MDSAGTKANAETGSMNKPSPLELTSLKALKKKEKAIAKTTVRKTSVLAISNRDGFIMIVPHVYGYFNSTHRY